MKTTLIKILLTAAFLAILFFKIDPSMIIQIISGLNLVYLAGSIAIVPILYGIRAFRWKIFLHSMGISIPFLRLSEVLLIGNFYGLITPGKLGELGRAYHINEKKSLTLPTIVMEKIVDLYTLIILSFVTIFFYFQDQAVLQIGIILCVLAISAGTLLLANASFIRYMARIFRLDPKHSEQFVSVFNSLIRKYPTIGYAFVISLIYYLAAYLLGYFVILSAGFDPIVIITLPIIVLMGNIPITISGLGLRESIGSLSFLYLGQPSAEGFVFAFLLFILITVFPGIVGYLLSIKEKLI
jgi:uncharacterized protein (TIRG00374 family)